MVDGLHTRDTSGLHGTICEPSGDMQFALNLPVLNIAIAHCCINVALQ